MHSYTRSAREKARMSTRFLSDRFVLRPSRHKILMAILPLSLSLLACARSVEQEVAGRLASAAGALGNTELRLYESRLCSGNYLEAKSDKDGRFLFRTGTANGGLSEIKQELTLCQKRNGSWQALWSSAHRGGASQIELTCTIQKEGKPACEPQFNYGA